MRKICLQMLFIITGLLSLPNLGFAQCDQNTIPGNCVKYVRSVVSPMPSTDLTSYASKLSIINHRFPTVGSVAVMPINGSSYGHVAVVRAVRVLPNGKLSLDLEESNFGVCAVRLNPNITPESRNIEGYYDYRYFNTNAPTPRIFGMTNFNGTQGNPFTVGISGEGFDLGSVEGIIMGGWCDSFGKCKVPNPAITKTSSSSIQVPVTLNAKGTYTLYLFNSGSGKTSNGQQINVN